MNDRYVGLTPYADWNSFFSFSRICTTFDMSTSIALVTCADVSSDLRMWSAIPRRIADIGSKLSPSDGSACGVAAAGGAGAAAGAGAGAAGAAGAGAAAAWPPASMNDWMSFFVTRPPEPEPGTCDGSIPCSAAMRATTGDTNDLPFSVPEAAGGAGSWTLSVGGASGCASWEAPSPSLAGALAASAAGWVAGSCAAG